MNTIESRTQELKNLKESELSYSSGNRPNGESLPNPDLRIQGPWASANGDSVHVGHLSRTLPTLLPQDENRGFHLYSSLS